MGCRKLSYYKEERGLEKSSLKILGAPEEKIQSSFFCNSYTPFGLAFNQYQRTASTRNRFLFNQGTGDKTFNTERIPQLGVDMTKFRVYDYAIGRFWQIDPLADQLNQESWTSYHYAFNNPILYNDPLGKNPIVPVLRFLAKKGVKWAAKTTKGSIKPVSRQQAKKIAQNKGTVYQVQKTSNKASKKLIKEANPGKKVVRHDGHQLKNGKTGMDHFQTQPGNGGHANYAKGVAGAATLTAAGSTDANASTSDASDSNESSIDAAVGIVSNATPQGAMMNEAADAGKTIFGDNAVGNFVDDWINPFGLGRDVVNLAIMGGIVINQEQNQNSQEEKKPQE